MNFVFFFHVQKEFPSAQFYSRDFHSTNCFTFFTLLQILFFELKDTQENKKRGPTYKLAGRKLQTTYWNVFKMVSCYASGAIFCQLMTDIGKKTIGRLRPNFIDVCKPNLSELCLMNNYSYITDYSCSVPDDEVNKSRYK